MPEKYRVFKRSATCWKHLARRGTTVRPGLTYEEAQRFCDDWNNNRTPAQIRAGTKMEFTAQ